MKPILIYSALALFLFAMPVSAQLNVGLVAHWKFNANCGDSSGNGYHGTANNITYTTGKSGMSNTAALFDGVSSYIMVGNQSGLNISDYSMCAMVRIDGYYTGLCQSSVIMSRGVDHTSGHYNLILSDNASDNVDCNALDTSKYCFYSNTKDKNTMVPNSGWNYTPSIVSSNWYCVVSTYANDTNKIYVNGALKSAVKLPTGSIGTTTDGIAIGASRFGNYTMYPYWLKGAIDDLRLYNRALSASEVSMFCSVASGVEDELTTVDPSISIYPNPNNGNFTISGIIKDGAQAHIEILNSVGQVVYQEELNQQGQFKKDISMHNLSSGVYVLKFNTADIVQSQNFVISR